MPKSPSPTVPRRQFTQSMDPITQTAATNEASDIAARSWPSSPWNAPAANQQQPDHSKETQVASLAVDGSDWFDGVKSALALVGLAAVALQLMRLVK